MAGKCRACLTSSLGKSKRFYYLTDVKYAIIHPYRVCHRANYITFRTNRSELLALQVWHTKRRRDAWTQTYVNGAIDSSGQALSISHGAREETHRLSLGALTHRLSKNKHGGYTRERNIKSHGEGKLDTCYHLTPQS